jgi:prepilin-type N-terminal cleavage/methylation domain-containing protein
MHLCRSKPSGPFRCRRIVSIKRLCTWRLSGKKRSGFTLVEILLAVFIFAIVLSIIYTSYTATFRIIDETEYQADVYRMARVTLERLYEDLESVYAAKSSESPESEEESRQVVEFVGEEAEINGKGPPSLQRARSIFWDS